MTGFHRAPAKHLFLAPGAAGWMAAPDRWTRLCPRRETRLLELTLLLQPRLRATPLLARALSAAPSQGLEAH